MYEGKKHTASITGNGEVILSAGYVSLISIYTIEMLTVPQSNKVASGPRAVGYW